MLILALGLWVTPAVLLVVLLTVCSWFEERHPLDRVLGPIRHEDLDAEWREWCS